MVKNMELDSKQVITEIEKMCGKSSDLAKREFIIGKKTLYLLYFESVSSDTKISDFIIKNFRFIDEKKLSISTLFLKLKNTTPNTKIKIIDKIEDLFFHLASGFTAIILDEHKWLVLETKSNLDRGVNEPTSENVIRGPKDSFTENHMINLGLIRKRIKDPNLWIEDTLVGRRTKSKVSVIYIHDIALLDKVAKIKEKLAQIDIDGILDSGYIREFLNNDKTSSFPKMISTERPDLVCQSLLNGKIVILIENSPFALILPGLFIDFFHTSDDECELPSNITFTRILRFIAFFITILTPALYIAVTTYNQEVIPTPLFISIAKQRSFVPFPTAFEVFILITAFEIMRESDIRTPSAMGSAMSIVGALVLGDAAVSAGIVSPIAVIIVALTSISGLIFSDIDMVNAIRLWRLLFIIPATFFGIIGFVFAFIIFMIHLASIDTLGLSYLTPITPFHFDQLIAGIIRIPKPQARKRPSYLTKKNQIKLGGNNEKNH